MLFAWIVLLCGAATAGQDANGLVILLNVSTDGRTLTISEVPQTGIIAPPQMPVGQYPIQPPAPPKQAPPPPPAPVQVAAIGIVDVFTDLNVRTGPSTSYQILGTLKPGEPVQIIGQQNGWYEILWHGRLAWICAYYVWLPGKELRNGGIRSAIASVYGPAAVPPPTRTPPSTPPPAPPSGSGKRDADGGLAIPVMDQNNIGAKYPDGFCGPTSCKMVLAYYGIDRDINFLGLANVGGATPVYHTGVGAGHQAMLDMLRYCGLKNSYMTHGQSLDWLRQQTANGTPVIVSVAGDYGAGFHTDGHILAVAGVTASGDVILSDSAGGHRRTVNGSMFYNAWGASNRMAIVCRP